MPKTGYRDDPENPVSQVFWGRVPVQMGTSLFRFEKGSSYQELLHDLKYRGNRRAGLYLGRLLGYELKETVYASCEWIVPVPLHRQRIRQRGYNQSEVIAKGVSEILDIPLLSHLLRRITHQASQTFAGRLERFQNVSGVYQLSVEPPDLNGTTILLIDDVVTTGATLEACSQVLLEHYDCTIYVATVSCA